MNKIIRITGTVKIFLLFLLILGRSYTSYSTTVQGVDVFNKVGHYKVTMLMTGYNQEFNYVQTPGSTVVAAYTGGMTESFASSYLLPMYPVPATVNMTFNGTENNNFSVTKSIVLPHAPGMVSDAFMYYTDITSYVQKNGSGKYLNSSTQTPISSKTMIVVEENPNFPVANVILNDYFYSNQDYLPETSYFTINLPSGMKVSSDVESQFQSFGGSIDGGDTFRGSVQQESAGNVLSPYQLLLNKTTNDYNKFFGRDSITNATYSVLKNVDTLKYKIDAVGGYDGTEVASWAYMYTPVVTPELKKTVSDENKNNVAEKGEIITYKAIFTNSTKEDISNLIVRDSLLMNLPEGVTLISQPTITGGSSISEIAGKPGEYNLDILRGNSSITMEYQLRMPTDNAQYEKLGSNIFNAISANDEIPDSSMCDKISVGCATMQTNSKIIPIKSVIDSNKNGVVEIGEELTYTITLDNTTGTGDSVSLSVKDSLLLSLPTGITLSSAPVASAGTLTTNAVGDYTLDKVAKGTLTTITYKLQVTSDAAEYKALGSNVVNAVTSDGSTPVVPTDPTDPTTPCAKAGTCTVTPTNATVAGTKALTAESITTNKIAEKGEELTYTITLDNSAGTNDAVLVPVKDSLLASLPTGITLSSGPTASTGTLTTNAIGDYTLDKVAKGTTVTVTYKLQITSDATEYKALGSNVVNVITTDGSTPVVPTDPTDPTNPCLVAKTCTVTPTNATVAGTKALTAESITTNKIAEKGEELTYTITLDNSAGVNDAVLVPVKDSLLASLPTGITLSSGPTASTGTLTGSAGNYTLDKVAKGTTVTVTYKLQVTSDIAEYKALGSNVVNVITTDGSTPVVPTDPTDPTNPCIIAKTCTVTPTNATVAGTKALTAESITTNKIAEKGEVLTYTITLDNSAGTNDAVLVAVKDSLLASLPTGITLSSGPTASTGTLTGSAGNYTLDKVAKGTTVTVTYKLQVTSDIAEYKALGSNVVNVITTDGSTPVVPTDPTDPTNPCLVAKTCTVTPTNATVAGTKALTAESITTNKIAEKGEVLTYTITLDNSAGTNDAVLVAVKDSLLASLPTGITLSSGPTASTGTLTGSAGNYTLDKVAKGTTVTVTYKLQVTSDIAEYKALGSNVVNVITTDGSTPVVPTDPTDPTNPCIVAKTCTVTPTNATVAGTKALTAESITTNKIAEKGEELTYTITLDNTTGTTDIYNVPVKDSLLASLPTGITLSSAPVASAGTLTGSAGNYTLDKVAKGTVVTLTYKLQITSDATEYKALGSNVVNVVTADGSTPVVPTDPTDPTTPCVVAKTCTVTPTNGIVAGTKALTAESITTNVIAEKGEVLTYTITLDNSAGTNDAVLVAVKDSLLASLPTGITLSSTPVASAGVLTGSAGNYTLDKVAKGTTVTVTYKLQITSDIAEYKALGSNVVNVITTDGSTPVVPTDPTDPTNPCLVAKTCTVTPTNATVAGTKALTAESITTNKIAEKGEVLTYTITLDNSAGTNDAVLVPVKDSLLASLPTGITLSSAPTASTGTLTTNAIGDYTLDKVAKGTTVTVTYKLQITSDIAEYKALGSNVVNVITTDGSTPVVPTDPTDPTNPCIIAKTCTVTPTNATVAGTKALTAESITTNKIAEKGEELTYTITLDNSAGTNDAVLVPVKDSLLASLPTGITLSSGPTASTGTLTTNAIGDYTLDKVAKGTTVTVTYKLQITSDATEYKALGSNVVNVITTDGSTPVVPTDPTDPTNPCLVAKTCTVTPTNATVAGTKALTAESITTNKIAEKGEELTYTITLDNSAGVNDAVLVPVKDSLLASLPTGITLSSGPTASTGTLTGSAGNYTLDKVAKGTTVTVTYKLQVTSDIAEYKALGSNVVNVITTDGSTPVVPTDPTDPTNPCLVAKTCTVTPTNATVAGTKALTAESITTNKIAEKGEVLTYTITLDNSAGTNDAVLVPVKDSLLASLPTGITLSSAPTASTGTLTTNAIGDYTLDKVAKGTLTTITYKLQVTSDAAEYKALGSNVVNAVTSDGSTPVVPTDPTDPTTPCAKAGTCTVTPTNPPVTSVKSLITESIKTDGLAQRAETLTYQVVLTNSSTTNDAVNVTFKDSLLTTIPAGVTVSEPTVSSGTITKVSTGVYTVDKISKGSTATVTYTVTLPKSSTEFKALGKYLINVVTSDGTDPVQPTDPTNPNEPCVLDKTCLVIPIKPESGQLTITKSASKSEVKVGDILGYTVTAINNSDSDVENAIIADMMPLGIVMIDGSSTYTLYASNGTVKEKGSITPTKNGSLMMYPFALIQPGEKVVIKYSTRIGAGVTVGGKYTNYAIGVTPTDDDPKTGDPFIDEIVNKIEATKSEQEKVISNTGTATVYVVEDKDFDNIPVIGKVFHDRDGDGYQDEAIARGVKVTLSGDNKNPVTIDTLGRTLVIKDITKPIYVGKIEGITTTSELSGEGNKVVLRRMVDPNNIGDITITTSEGTNVTLKADGTTVSDNKGKVLKGDSNQDIAISRKVLSNQEMVVDTETVKETKVISNIVSPVHFDSGKSEIKADYLAKLDETLKSLKGKENVRIVAVGYTDSQKLSSTSKYKNNNELSEDRARQVADYLAKELNLSPDSIETEGRGESNPVVPNVAGYGEATRANRRTEIEIRYDEVVESKVPAQKVKVKGYMEEITIKNLGLQEEGIPGVRLITPEGQIIETDQYGRYHIPRVENIGEKGRNVIVKVDSITLPKGSIFTTENPRVKWVTPYLINDFNFGVQFKEDGGAK